MASQNYSHSASDSFLGFLYQLERALEWLSKLDTPESVVGIEVEDDVVINLKNTTENTNIYEQDKYSTEKLPFSDKSEDVWKTLFNWLTAINNGTINPTNSKFILICNRSLPKKRLIWELSNCNNEDVAQSLVIKLKEKAITLRGKLKKYGELIFSSTDDVLVKLILNLNVFDKIEILSRLTERNNIKSRLHISDDIPTNYIIERLRGYIQTYALNCWKERIPCFIRVDAFNRQLTQLISEYISLPFLEKTINQIPVSENQISVGFRMNFISQLKLIECSDDELLESIHDYFRHRSEVIRMAEDGEISPSLFDDYYDNLNSHWETISRPKFKYITIGDEVKTGYEVYYETIKYRGSIKGYQPHQTYTFKGAYHKLSDDLRIGWHPSWEIEFNK